MGWFPARDKNNRVPPELLNWPQSSEGSGGKKWVGGPRYHRAMQYGTGRDNDGKHAPQSDAKLLAENARRYGYVNGVKVGGKHNG